MIPTVVFNVAKANPIGSYVFSPLKSVLGVGTWNLATQKQLK